MSESGNQESEIAKSQNENRKPGSPTSDFCIFRFLISLVPVLLHARSAQTGQTEALNGALPGKKLFHRKRIPAACVFETQEAAADCNYDLCFAPDHPALGIGRRQVRQCKRAAIRSDHVAYAR